MDDTLPGLQRAYRRQLEEMAALSQWETDWRDSIKATIRLGQEKFIKKNACSTNDRNDPATESCIRWYEESDIFLPNKPDSNELQRAWLEEKCPTYAN